jgi:DNA-directed RNA polymerase subunit RPC12/RpoP
MMEDVPAQFKLRLLKPHTLQLAVPRKQVNLFLSTLWDELTENIGRVGCQHRYVPTSDPEIYIYTVFWSDVSLSFDAEINFTNHTAKGLMKISVAAINRGNGQEDVDLAQKILKLASETQKKLSQTKSSSPSTLVRVPILTRLPLNGIYELVDAVIFPSPERVDLPDEAEGFSVSFLEFWVYSTNNSEIYAEVQEKAQDIAASLSLLTQNLFLESPSGLSFYQPEKLQGRQEIIEQMTQGLFIADDGLIENQIKPDEDGAIHLDVRAMTKDIVEPDDSVIDRTIALPMRAKQALQYILSTKALIQAARRFQEGLKLHVKVFRPGSSDGTYIPYALIAFVATIEAILDTTPKNIEYVCPSCGEKITIKERQINKGFLSFVREHSDNNLLMEKHFKEMYDDRSKFVHTGKDLYNPSALRANRPLILEGKNTKKFLPEYTYIMPDLCGWLIRRYVYRSMQ